MNELHTDVSGAMEWVAMYHKELESRFFCALRSIPRWEEPIGWWVVEYCDGLGNWVRANDTWSFESERYFGKKGLHIMRNRWVSLMPKEHSEEVGPILVNDSVI